MRYAKVDLSTSTLINFGLPAELVGWTGDALADVAGALDPCPDEWRGFGFWPVVEVAPDYDPDTHRLSDDVVYLADATTRMVTATRSSVPLTAAEVEAGKASLVAAVRARADSLLDALDGKSVRPLRASLAGTATVADTDKLGALEDAANATRVKRSALVAAISAAADLKVARAIDTNTGWPSF